MFIGTARILERSDFFVLFGCLVIHLALRFRRSSKNGLPLPPGPRRWPLIGSAFSFPRQYSARAFAKTSKEYGSKIVYHEVFGRPIVILNDIQMSKDLMEKRSSIYSNRPQLRMIKDIMKVDQFFALIPYGDKWRYHRRIFQQYFSPQLNIDPVHDVELDFIRKGLLPKLYQDPDHYREIIGNCLGGMSTSLTYGLPVLRDNDPMVHLVEEAFATVALAAVPGAFLVELLPWLQYVPAWMPGAAFKRNGKRWASMIRHAVEEPFRITQLALSNGQAKKSFLSTSLEDCRPDDDNEKQQIKEVAAMVYGAAFETTTAAVLSFILAMLKHPEVQQKVQQELDTVLGPDRLPDFSDKSSLPYLSAVLKEVFRWNPIAPMGFPHQSDQADVYAGYYIPEGSTVIANTYGILQDEETYENPEVFDPERYLENGQLSFQVPDPEVVATFGFGRRVCPGAHIALSTTYITAVSILTAFDISYDTDENGKQIDVPLESFSSIGTISVPLPFKCKITPRAGKNVEDLLKDYKDVEVII